MTQTRRTPDELIELIDSVLDEYERDISEIVAGERLGLNAILKSHEVRPWVFYRRLKSEPERQERYEGIMLDVDMQLDERATMLLLTPAQKLQDKGEDFRQVNYLLGACRTRAGAALFHKRMTPLLDTSLDVKRLDHHHEHTADDSFRHALGAFASIAQRLLPAATDAETVIDADHELVGTIDLDAVESA